MNLCLIYLTILCTIINSAHPYFAEVPSECQIFTTEVEKISCMQEICPKLKNKEFTSEMGLNACQVHCKQGGTYFPDICPYSKVPGCICKDGYCRDHKDFTICKRVRNSRWNAQIRHVSSFSKSARMKI
ncbi:uncharacterized protein LOC123295869 [Chrysoperla carnea]|uniref:uncharacterized protein LOC123295869 n=1 Tax=Chrysoperla carnea TaxID=189513 RepID=UPI001D08F117|nr:uncharacterized protein LOC123295869 [Chrysoperla carnea]